MKYLRLQGYTDENYSDKLEGAYYSAMINPESLKRKQSLVYNEQQAADTLSTEQKFKHAPSDVISFEIVIDCTGIVDKKRTDMYKEIDLLEHIVYKYNKKIHRPNYVQILWGTNKNFNGVLKSMDTTYTLFKPDGTPLRAKVSMTFSQYVSEEMMKMLMASESPDLSHFVTVVEGDQLPQLCTKMWGNPDQYINVAKFNGMNKFRRMMPGTELVFPPIIQPS